MAPSPIVATVSGKVRGRNCKTHRGNRPYYAFKAVPYAKPPTGNLRYAHIVYTLLFTPYAYK
jgi:carboxylesterase type B